MSKYEESFIGIGTYISVLAIFALTTIGFWIFEYRRKKKFINFATQNNEMSKEQAEALYKIRGNRKLLHPSDKRFRRLDVFQIRHSQAESFYQLHRWIKNIKEAKRTNHLEAYAEELVKEMETRMHLYPLSSRDQKRLWELSMLPESVLNKYDYDYAVSSP